MCFKKVMLAIDFSECSLSILDHIAELKKAGMEEAVLIRVINLTRFTGAAAGFDIESWIELQEKDSKTKLDELVKKIERTGVIARYIKPIPAGDPVVEIVEAAKKEKVSLIIVASRGKSIIKEILLGSVSEGVIRKANRPVLLIKSKKGCYSGNIFKKIIYAHDLSDHANSMLECIKLASLAGGKDVVLLHVEEDEQEDKSKLEFCENELKKAGVDVKVCIRRGTPHKVILKVAEEENATLIAVASRGLGFVEGMILGSTTDAITRRSKIPVYVYH